MILRRLRARVPVYLSALMLLVGATLALANEPITRSQAESMIDARIAAAGVIVFGAFWVLLLTISGRSEKALAASIDRLDKTVAEFKRALETHNESPFAHGPASEHNHAPLMAKLERIEAENERIDADIDRMKTGLEEFVRFCKSHQCALGARSPADSPKPRREDDPPDFDGTKHRGRA